MGAGRDRWRLGYIASYGWMERERLAPMAARSSPAHASPEMIPATQPAGGTEVPLSWRPFLRRHGLPTAAARSAGGQARQQPPAAGPTHPGCHPPRGSIQLARGGVRGTRARATKSASLSAAGLGAATTSADGSVSRLSGSDGEYSLRVGPTKGSPWIRFGRLRSRKCHIVTCQPYVTQSESGG